MRKSDNFRPGPPAASGYKPGSRGLSDAKRQQIEDQLKETGAQMEQHRATLEDWKKAPIADKERCRADHAERQHAIARAIRAGMIGHPDVRDWLAGLRAMGEIKSLRRFKNLYSPGLETGVSKMMPKADAWVVFHAAELLEQDNGFENIRRELLKRAAAGANDRARELFGLSPSDMSEICKRLKRSKQAFHKWLRRLEIAS